jgi:hypothetical protein
VRTDEAAPDAQRIVIWLRLGMRAFAVLTAIAAVAPEPLQADEGGVSFWLPGLFGSLAAVPSEPGWSFAALYYHSSVNAGGDKDFPRGGNVRVGLSGRADILAFGPTYTLERPVLGGQAAASLLGLVGYSEASVDATLTGPNGNRISGAQSQSLFSYGDLLPQVTLKWNDGVNNSMLYLTGDVPVGDYNPDRLANVGIGHAAIDGGYGYTFLNPDTGREFSAVAGLTYNFENPDTDYKNGIDGHIDFGVSQFLNEQVQVGAVGYFFQQLTGDSGDGATLGAFEGRVAGIGPQVGYFFPAGRMQGYLNLKGYYEFAAENRPEGWNVWLSVALAPPAPAH